ncbi:hypothetical protein GCM10010361_14580 [Streptomyces olivaceiscleroticus]|uniref:Uncharacterized protein n=1 Tax=Streptomyces olivaceiscleroticus TaxID=68245 RepID=A0ABN0ZL62_9ACTN
MPPAAANPAIASDSILDFPFPLKCPSALGTCGASASTTPQCQTLTPVSLVPVKDSCHVYADVPHALEPGARLERSMSGTSL